MSERIKLLCEGPHDRAFLDALIQIDALDPSRVLDLPRKGAKLEGLSDLEKQLESHLLAGAATLAVRDFDALDGPGLRDWLAQRLKVVGLACPPPEPLTERLDAFIARPMGRAPVAVVGVGRLADTPPELTAGGRHNLDEHVFRLLRDREVYEGTAQLNECPFDVWLEKIDEVSALVVSNGLPRQGIKQLARLPHLLTAWEGAPPTLIERLVRSAGTTARVVELTEPLVTALRAALDALHPPAEVP